MDERTRSVRLGVTKWKTEIVTSADVQMDITLGLEVVKIDINFFYIRSLLSYFMTSPKWSTFVFLCTCIILNLRQFPVMTLNVM